METSKRFCAVCIKPLPQGSRKSRQFCSDNCSAKARQRRAKGKPIADPTATPEEIANLKLQLVQQQETIVQLQKANAKLQKQLATARRKEAAATAKLATRDKQNADQQDQHARNLQTNFDLAQTINTNLAQRYEAAMQLVQQRDQQIAELPQLKQIQSDFTKMEEYATDLTRMYEALYRRWYMLQSDHILVCNDFLNFEYYVRKNKPEFKMSPQDFDRFRRASRLRKHMPVMPRKRTIPMPKSTPKEYLQ